MQTLAFDSHWNSTSLQPTLSRFCTVGVLVVVAVVVVVAMVVVVLVLVLVLVLV